MKLTVIIVSYNVKELLDNCLKSVKESSNNITLETIVVDNDSSDGSADFVKRNHKWVKVIENKKNVGFSSANNQGIKIGKGEYVLILNPDTELQPDTLVKMLNFMDKSSPRLAVSTCRVELANGQLDKDCRRLFPTPWRAFTHFSGLSKIFKNSKTFDSYYLNFIPESEEIEIDSCVGAFMLIKKSVIREVGGFDEEFFFYGEDLDLCYRIKEKGYKIIYTPITKIIHHKGASSGIKKHTQQLSKATVGSKKRIIKESTRAMELFYKKHYFDEYPRLLTLLVILSIKLVEKIRLIKLNI